MSSKDHLPGDEQIRGDATTPEVMGAFHDSRRESSSAWHFAGALWGLWAWSLRNTSHPATAVALVLGSWLGSEIVTEIEEAVEDVEKGLRGGSPGPPPVPPIKQSQLEMDGLSPPPEVSAPWPPFTGVRVELGGDGA